MPRKKRTDSPAAPNADDAIASIKYPAKRKNIPPAGLEAQGVLQEAPRLHYEYNSHLPPVLRSVPDAAEADKLQELLATARQRALTDGEARTFADALRRHEPWLEWSGKREKPWFEVEPVALRDRQQMARGLLAEKLAALNEALETHTKPRSLEGKALREKLVGKLKTKCREQKASSLSEADHRRWLLPGTDPLLLQPATGVLTAKQSADLRAFVSSCEIEWKEWQVPFDTDPDWPKPMAELVDKPEVVKGVVRVGLDDHRRDACATFELQSLPFPRPERRSKGETWRVAVKVIDPRGNEGLRVLAIQE